MAEILSPRLPRLTDGTCFTEGESMRALLSKIESVADLRSALSQFYVPWQAYLAFLERVSVARKPDGAYKEIQEYINWRRQQPEKTGSRQMPRCIDNSSGNEMINWRDEFIRVCTNIGHLWIARDRLVAPGHGGSWPVLAYPPWDSDIALPLLWIDYDPYDGVFDVVTHTFKPETERVITITMISVVEVGCQEISRVVVDLDRPEDAREAASYGSGALTISVTWIRPGEVGPRRQREIPKLNVISGVPNVDFAFLLTMTSNRPTVRLQRHFVSLTLCQGFEKRAKESWSPPKGTNKKMTYAHSCPCYKGDHTPRFAGFQPE